MQLVRLEERLKIIMESMTLDRNARKEQYEKMEEISEKLTVLTLRVGTVEDGFARSAPTIEEFITIYHIHYCTPRISVKTKSAAVPLS